MTLTDERNSRFDFMEFLSTFPGVSEEAYELVKSLPALQYELLGMLDRRLGLEENERDTYFVEFLQSRNRSQPQAHYNGKSRVQIA